VTLPAPPAGRLPSTSSAPSSAGRQPSAVSAPVFGLPAAAPPTVARAVPSTRPAETPFAAATRPAPRSTAVRRAPALEPIAEPAAPPAAPAVPLEDHFGLALYFQRIGDFDNALVHYRALLEKNDASAELHNNLGLLYEDHGQRDDAVKQFQRAIALDPKYV
jgi:hypothetical protein